MTPRCGAKVLSFAGKIYFGDHLRFAVEKDTINLYVACIYIYMYIYIYLYVHIHIYIYILC